jgi:SAM-dependent methyltransferase
MAPSIPLSRIQSEYRTAFLEKLNAGEYGLEGVGSCLCRASGGVRVAECDRFGIPIGVVVCANCGLARTTPRLAATNLTAFYENDYHGLHQGVRNPDASTALFRAGQGAAIHTRLAGMLPSGPLRIADVGAGTGQVLREFERAVGRAGLVTAGCEYATAFVIAGKQAGTDLRHGGPDTLNDLAPFDVVILSHVVEHFPDPVRELAAVRSLGHANTLFYVEVPGILAIDCKAEYAYRFQQYLTVAHMFHFSLATLTATFARAGFALVHGDDDVHSIYRIASVSEPRSDPSLASATLASLHHLETSWPLRAKRLLPAVRQSVAAAAKSTLPKSIVRMLGRH